MIKIVKQLIVNFCTMIEFSKTILFFLMEDGYVFSGTV